ncbi:MAG: TRAP transporter small permease [Desulfuromonadales bacterium]|nr:TRAP transporter small permease [Desulfuromonadales bacterium]
MSQMTDHFARRLNWVVERLCALLVALMVLDVWLGVISRYMVDLQITWTEELARYLMIWGSLLAVSCGVYYREHVGLMLLLESLPSKLQMVIRVVLDLLGLAFFLVLTWYGFNMARDGASQYATIFNMTMTVPFAAVPVSAGLAALQMLLVSIRDLTHLAPGEKQS